VLLAAGNFSSAEERTTLIIGALVFVAILLGAVASVIWKSGWKQGRDFRSPEEIDHAAIARGLALRLLGLVFLVGPLLLIVVAVAGGILVGIATLFGASLLLDTLVAAAILLGAAVLCGLRNLEDFLGERADYISAKRVKAIDQEMLERLQQTRER
jgi:hypothetical protein